MPSLDQEPWLPREWDARSREARRREADRLGFFIDYDKATALAVKALAADESHRVAFNWIVNIASGLYRSPYRPGGHDGDRATCFVAGRHFVGQEIMKLVAMPMVLFDRQTEKPAPRRRRVSKGET